MKLDDFICLYDDSERVRVAVPMANDPDAVRCIAAALGYGLANFLLVGDLDAIKTVADENEVDISRAEFVGCASEEKEACRVAASCVKDGAADILMKGLVATSTFTRSVLDRDNGFVSPGSLISHVGIFEVPSYHKLLIVTDAAINIMPDLDAKKSILVNAIEFAVGLGIDAPKVACIAPVEKVNEKIQSTVDARRLQDMAGDGYFGNVMVEGPLAVDVALSAEAAGVKGLGSRIAGDVDIMLMPNLDAGNAFYKSLTYLAGAKSASLIAGANMPVVLTSRADSEATKLASVALAARIASRG